MTFATQFIEEAESAYAFTPQTVIWNGETYKNALMEKFTLSFTNLKDGDNFLEIKVNEDIPDNLGFGEHIRGLLGTIRIPLDKLAEKYNTTVDVIKNIFGNKMNHWQAESYDGEWYEGVEELLSKNHPNWNIFSFYELTFEYESDFTTTNIDQIIDDVLAGIIEYDTRLNQ